MAQGSFVNRRGRVCSGHSFGLPPDEVARLIEQRDAQLEAERLERERAERMAAEQQQEQQGS